ncbi:thioredoxin H3-like [Vigna unguiculata]|uniref:thioredoxin H3-like n=1 Tax=Vigna unguiculata TaxID=3917 RepID=UPI00101657D9|nr:thioredoxin H3-like [Vigna unguiculata]
MFQTILPSTKPIKKPHTPTFSYIMPPTIYNFKSFRSSGSFNYSTPKKDSDSNILTFHTTDKWNAHFKAVKETNKLMVLDFTATWCKPCKLMDPVVEEFAAKYTDAEFIKIDVEELNEVSQALQVYRLPTFILVKKGKVADRVEGVMKEELKRSIENHTK